MSRLAMTILEEAMLRHMKYVVQIEHRPFSYIDFESFQIDNQYYSVSHGTCRNKFSKFVRIGLIEFEFNTKLSYYTLKGHHFGASNMMTLNHMGISSVIPVTGVIRIGMQNLFNYLQTVASEQASVHDIHFKFTALGIYETLSSSQKYGKLIKPVSYDIVLSSEIIDGFKIIPIIHRTDTVTVSVGCSTSPVPISEAGITRLSCALTRAEERLSYKVDECGTKLPGGYEKIPIPDNLRWLVTMWHFGNDRNHEYKKDGYSLTWGYGREVLRLYSKTIQGQQKERQEIQEYPNKTLAEAFDEKGILERLK
jgi:hypothetical protein